MFRRQRQVTGVSTREVRHPALRIIRHGVPSDIARLQELRVCRNVDGTPPYAPQVCEGGAMLAEGTGPETASSTEGDRRGQINTGCVAAHVGLGQLHRRASLGGGVQRVHADAGEDQGVLALEETL